MARVHEVTFNYTLNSPARQLLQMFEGLARQQELVMLLERRMKYDRLGINDALLQFESDLNRKLLPEPQRALARPGSDRRRFPFRRDRPTAGPRPSRTHPPPELGASDPSPASWTNTYTDVPLVT